MLGFIHTVNIIIIIINNVKDCTKISLLALSHFSLNPSLFLVRPIFVLPFTGLAEFCAEQSSICQYKKNLQRFSFRRSEVDYKAILYPIETFRDLKDSSACPCCRRCREKHVSKNVKGSLEYLSEIFSRYYEYFAI